MKYGTYIFPAPSPPSGLSANSILSTTSLSISWMSVSGAVGYIVDYNGGQAELIEGKDSADHFTGWVEQGNYLPYQSFLATVDSFQHLII